MEGFEKDFKVLCHLIKYHLGHENSISDWNAEKFEDATVFTDPGNTHYKYMVLGNKICGYEPKYYSDKETYRMLCHSHAPNSLGKHYSMTTCEE